jgi:hypothetical protein
MKITTLIIMGLLLFTTGCSQKKSFFSEDALEQSSVINTQKGQLYNSLEIKASIVSTYLNASNPLYKDSKNEMFLVSIFIDDDSSDAKKFGIYNRDYLLTLNGAKAISIKKLDFEDDLIKIAPIRNRWSTYYLVEFEAVNDEKLLMSFKNDAYGEVVLEYLKEF